MALEVENLEPRVLFLCFFQHAVSVLVGKRTGEQFYKQTERILAGEWRGNGGKKVLAADQHEAGVEREVVARDVGGRLFFF